MKRKAALIVDKLQVTQWQLDALQAANDSLEILLVLNCQNTRTKKRLLKHFFYYVLNALSLQNYLTRRRQVRFPNAKVIDFESTNNGAWQSLPEGIYDELKRSEIDVVIKFGMNLLRVDEDKSSPPILSYHHGDPSKYRGRPAGFYEVLSGEKTIGIIVQTLSNELDAGEIYAFAESKVVSYSYKKTALNFYLNSAPLLNKAVANFAAGLKVDRKSDGKNYRLPSNFKVLRFLALLGVNAIKKIVYGLFFEKKWRVATTKNVLAMTQSEILLSRNFNEIPISKNYNFYADPFFSEDGSKIRLEALGNKSGLGDILELEASDVSRCTTLATGKHFSYPCSFAFKGKEYILPEVASHSAPYFCEPIKSDIRYYLKGLEEKRIVDATLYFTEDKCYLFFGEDHSAHTVLNLWLSESPFDVFKPHPKSPIAISPSDARMGGKPISFHQKLLRFGQNNSGEYGESLAIMQITTLSDMDYKEVKLGTIRIDKFSGPHCLSFSPDKKELLVDYYRNEFSLFAGVRRIKARWRKR